MIDLHTHLLPGLDDGPKTLDGSLELARQMVADGVTIAACTPHVRDDHPTSPDQMERALSELSVALVREGIALDVRRGGEVALDKLARLSADDVRRFGLGGNPNLLLIEFPYYGWPLALPLVVSELRSAGIVALLAHPERNPEVQERPARLVALVEAGARVQLTAGSVDGSAGQAAAKCAHALIEQELAHVIASDSHGGEIRRSGMASARRVIRDEALGVWLTLDSPSALLDGREPAAPVANPGKSRFFRRR